MTAASCVLSVIYQVRNQLKALKLAVGDATETTVAAVKLAASSESDCDMVHKTHLAERVWMWAQADSQLRQPSVTCIVTPSSHH